MKNQTGQQLAFMGKKNRSILSKLRVIIKDYIVLLIAVMLLTLSASAQKIRVLVKATDVVIEGKILDSNIIKMPNGQTEVSIMVSKYPFSRELIERADNIADTLKVKNGQHFKFVIPGLADRLYLSIKYASEKAGDYYFQQWFDNIYILEKGDRVNCILSDKTFRFSGKGATKLNCQTEIYQVKMRENDEDVKILQGGDWNKIYDIQNRLMDSVFIVRNKIISKHAQQMGKDMTLIMQANNLGLKYFETMYHARVMAGETRRYHGYLNSTSYKNLKRDIISPIDDNFLVAAPIYVHILFESIMMQTRIVVNGIIEPNFSERHIKNVFEVIKGQPSGVIRSKLLGMFFTQWKDQPSIYNFIDEGLNLTTDAIYKEIIIEINAARSKHVAFYPFKLENDKGKIVKLEDLKNKVVIIDFWFTGCSGCAGLKKNMEGVWNSYKGDSKVRFVSISIDKDKAKWKKSILSRKYTEPEAINLYTGGLGSGHPIIKALKINSYPQMYLLKEGKITGNIPYPSGPDTTKGTTKEFIELIARLINEK